MALSDSGTKEIYTESSYDKYTELTIPFAYNDQDDVMVQCQRGDELITLQQGTDYLIPYPFYDKPLFEDGATWIEQKLESGKTYNSVIYANNMFVAVGDGHIATSSDGLNWTEQVLESGIMYNDVAYSGSLFVAVGYAGYIATSADGLTWTEQVLESGSPYFCVAYGNGKFVAISGFMYIATSTDGENWVETYTTTSIFGKSMIYNNDTFIVLTGNQIYTSSNGTEWASIDLTAEYEAIAYGDKQYVMVGGSGKAAVSSDATDWTEYTRSTTTYCSALAYGGGSFVTIDNERHALLSVDGLYWKEYPISELQVYNSMVYAQENFVAVGGSGSIATFPIQNRIADPYKVVLLTAIEDIDTLTVYRKTPIDQQAVFPQNAKFNSEKLNDALDKACMIQQEQAEHIERSFKLPIGVSPFDSTVPVPDAGKTLKINKDGTGLEWTKYNVDTVVDDVNSIAEQNIKDMTELLTETQASEHNASIAAASTAQDMAECSAIVAETGSHLDAVQSLVTGFDSKVEEATTQIEESTAELNQAFSDFDTNAKNKTDTFNENVNTQWDNFSDYANLAYNNYNKNAATKVDEYNTNATEKINTYNTNAEDSTNMYNTNAEEKLSTYNTNAETKQTSLDNAYNTVLNKFNDNVETKTEAYNDNATWMENEFTNLVQNKAVSFGVNARELTEEFNTNAAEKQAEVDASAANAQTWAEGTDTNVAALGGTHSAKGWADVAQELVTSLGLGTFAVQVVDTLPIENISATTIYFVHKEGEADDVFNEYMYINNQWELIGNTAVDLSNYLTKQELSDSLNVKVTYDSTTKKLDATLDEIREWINEGKNVYVLEGTTCYTLDTVADYGITFKHNVVAENRQGIHYASEASLTINSYGNVSILTKDHGLYTAGDNIIITPQESGSTYTSSKISVSSNVATKQDVLDQTTVLIKEDASTVSGYEKGFDEIIALINEGKNVCLFEEGEVYYLNYTDGINLVVFSKAAVYNSLIPDIQNTNITITAGDSVNKQVTYSTIFAGDNVTISGNQISAIDTTYTAGSGVEITEDNVINNTSPRIVGSIVSSLAPLNDDGLHLLDGAELPVGGIYDDFVTGYIKDLYENSVTYTPSYNCEPVGDMTVTTTATSATVSNMSTGSYFNHTELASYLASQSGLLPPFTFSIQFTTPSSLSNLHGLTLFEYKDDTVLESKSFLVGFDTYNKPYFQAPIYKDGVISNQYFSIDTVDILPNTTYRIDCNYEPSYDITMSIVGINTIDRVYETQTLSLSSDEGIITNTSTGTEYCHLFKNWIGSAEITPDKFYFDIYDSNTSTYDSYTIIESIAETPSANFVTEQEWQDTVAQYGVCGKFVYNEGISVRLPKVSGFIEGTSDSNTLGNITEAGLPNITGQFVTDSGATAITGAFYATDTTATGEKGGAGGTGDIVGFDASQSNSIYSNSTTVQPQSIKVYYYIVVGTTTKTDVEVDIDNIATDLNNKADKDLSNCTSSTFVDGHWVGKISVLSTAMPKGVTEIDMSEYLPEDNYQYEVLMLFSISSSADTTATTPGAQIYSDIVPQPTTMQMIANTYGRWQSTYITMPIGTGRKLYQWLNAAGATGSKYGIEALAYRRLGTNA